MLVFTVVLPALAQRDTPTLDVIYDHQTHQFVIDHRIKRDFHNPFSDGFSLDTRSGQIDISLFNVSSQEAQNLKQIFAKKSPITKNNCTAFTSDEALSLCLEENPSLTKAQQVSLTTFAQQGGHYTVNVYRPSPPSMAMDQLSKILIASGQNDLIQQTPRCDDCDSDILIQYRPFK